MTDELIELAERCEAADGPSRELDAEIALAIGYDVKYDRGNDPTPYYEPIKEYSWQPVLAYTASLDSAMTLVPEALPFEVQRSSRGCKSEAFVWNGKEIGEGSSAVGSTPALALIAAALRARKEEG